MITFSTIRRKKFQPCLVSYRRRLPFSIVFFWGGDEDYLVYVKRRSTFIFVAFPEDESDVIFHWQFSIWHSSESASAQKCLENCVHRPSCMINCELGYTLLFACDCVAIIYPTIWRTRYTYELKCTRNKCERRTAWDFIQRLRTFGEHGVVHPWKAALGFSKSTMSGQCSLDFEEQWLHKYSQVLAHIASQVCVSPTARLLLNDDSTTWLILDDFYEQAHYISFCLFSEVIGEI